MKSERVYDLPTRVFHWLFAALFIFAFTIGKTVDDESVTFSLHMMAGLTMGILVWLRIFWGIFGTRHARFTGFVLNPATLVSYMKGIFTGDKRRWAGHNPASSWAAIVMMALALGLGFTGFQMTTGPENESLEEIHELLANGFLLVALAHVAGVVLHTVRHKEMIGLSMITGRKDAVAAADKIESNRPVFALVMLALVTAYAISLYRNFDPQTRTLNLFGTTLQLGENEGEEGEAEGEGRERGNRESHEEHGGGSEGDED